MAFKLDNDLLEELGLAALSAEEKQAMLRQILETLEMRVGTTLASNMTDAQLDEFEQLMPNQADDQSMVQRKEQQALQWLESNFPHYKQVVSTELDKLKEEIKQSAPQILAASQQQATPIASQPTYQQDSVSQPTYQPTAGSTVTNSGSYQSLSPIASSQGSAVPVQPAPGFVDPTSPAQSQPLYQPLPSTDALQSDDRQYPPQAN